MSDLSDQLSQQDRRILDLLQADGRMTTSKLADLVGMSTSAAQKRLRKLERDGFITDYRAHLDPQKSGHARLVYVQVKLADSKRATLDEFNASVMGIPEVLSCDMLTGGFDYLLKVRCRDLQSFTELHGDIIAGLPGVLQTLSFPVMKEVKDTSAFGMA